MKDIGQVFVDVACSTCVFLLPDPIAYTGSVHRWLHDNPGILHRDLSFNNIMCRTLKEKNAQGEDEERVYGVLTDYDLSSWTADLANDYTRTSQQRTGTPPYMAQELLSGTCDTHLYRHDVESLFYVMLMLCARHTIGSPVKGEEQRVIMRKGELPYERWFNEPDYEALADHKIGFFSRTAAIQLSAAFEDFSPWLTDLKYRFSEGFGAMNSYERRKIRAGSSAGGLVAFDDETLGGNIDYSSLIEPARSLKGELEDLIIRYNPEPSQPSTPTT